jgi:hypothetical protein
MHTCSDTQDKPEHMSIKDLLKNAHSNLTDIVKYWKQFMPTIGRVTETT